MLSLLSPFLSMLFSVFRSRAALQVEILALRHQIGVLQRSTKKRPKLTVVDRVFWACLSGVWADWESALVIVKPKTFIAWHRKGFRLFWTWKVRHGRTGRPAVSCQVRQLIRTMSRANPLWGAPRIHGELLKLGIEAGETSVGKYMVRHRKPPTQTWRTFLENHISQLVSVDFFTVPTIPFQALYVFLVLAHERRRILHFNVTKLIRPRNGPPNNSQCVPLGLGTPLSVARPGSKLWRQLHPAGSGHGHRTSFSLRRDPRGKGLILSASSAPSDGSSSIM
jgi:putative transposase